MKNGIVVIAHAPLASALRLCVSHVFPEQGDDVVAVDIQPQAGPEESLAQVQQAVAGLGASPLLILVDVLGATPCNVARRLRTGGDVRLIAGVNLSMLLRAVTYRNEPLEQLAQRALQGGIQGVLQIEAA